MTKGDSAKAGSTVASAKCNRCIIRYGMIQYAPVYFITSTWSVPKQTRQTSSSSIADIDHTRLLLPLLYYMHLHTTTRLSGMCLNYTVCPVDTTNHKLSSRWNLGFQSALFREALLRSCRSDNGFHTSIYGILPSRARPQWPWMRVCCPLAGRILTGRTFDVLAWYFLFLAHVRWRDHDPSVY